MAKTKILIVEDERIVAEDIKRGLQHLGYDVPSVVASGKEAIKKAEEEEPNLVLMNIVLRGEMDGIEAANEIHSRFDIPVIYITGYVDEDKLKRAKITEPFGYLFKPFEDKELHSNIQMALYKHEMEKRLKQLCRELQRATKAIKDIIDTIAKVVEPN